MNPWQHWIVRIKDAMKRRSYFYQVLGGSLFLFVALVINVHANRYASAHASGVVQDLFLNALPMINLDNIYLEGYVILLSAIVLLAVYWPNKLPFLLKSIGLFVLIRSFFLVLTHLSVPLPAVNNGMYFPDHTLIQSLSGGDDLFFSGHTGLPFLMALAFWKNRYLRTAFLMTSIVFGASVLLAHVHYSIDVFAAFFITYTIHDLAVFLFKKEHLLFLDDHALPSLVKK
ncbi:hypothetical protein KBB27_03865 [Patescibacteria group bacterium]|nr:hypothetical protein [Patescibacteria group bacterium]